MPGDRPDEVVVAQRQQFGRAGNSDGQQRLGLRQLRRPLGLGTVALPLLIQPVRLVDARHDERHVILGQGAGHGLLGGRTHRFERFPRVPGLLPQGVDEAVVTEQQDVRGRIEADHGRGLDALRVVGPDPRGPGRDVRCRGGRGRGGRCEGTGDGGQCGGRHDGAREGGPHPCGSSVSGVHADSSHSSAAVKGSAEWMRNRGEGKGPWRKGFRAGESPDRCDA